MKTSRAARQEEFKALSLLAANGRLLIRAEIKRFVQLAEEFGNKRQVEAKSLQKP